MLTKLLTLFILPTTPRDHRPSLTPKKKEVRNMAENLDMRLRISNIPSILGDTVGRSCESKVLIGGKDSSLAYKCHHHLCSAESPNPKPNGNLG